MKRIEVGDMAPSLVMTTHTGEPLSLSDFQGKQSVVLFFYPKDGTPICTKEACAFRDSFEQFADLDAVVLGVSGDSVDRHQRFAEKHGLQFMLVDDHDGSVRRAFHVHRTAGIMPGRVTYVIDQDGIVRHIFSAQLAADRHVQEALTVLRELREHALV